MIEIDGRRTISRINENTVNGTDVSNDIKYIRDTKWSENDLLKANREYFKNTAAHSSIGFLIIDDSVMEKAGRPKHMEGLGWHFSHSKGKAVYGHCLVSSHYRYGDISFPYDFKFYMGEKECKKSGTPFMTKIDIAREFIENFQTFNDEKVYTLIDTWYTSKDVIASAKSRGFHVIGGLKSNRIFRLSENGCKHKLSTYARNLRNASFDEIIINDAAYQVKRVNCFISGAGKVTILISKRKKDRSKRFILSTDTSLSSEEILQYYSFRWDIETGYLYCKDRLGIGHYQMRKMKAIKKYCALIFSAFCYLEALRLINNQLSIGQSRRIFKIKRKKDFIDKVAKLVRKGVSMKKIYQELKVAA